MVRYMDILFSLFINHFIMLLQMTNQLPVHLVRHILPFHQFLILNTIAVKKIRFEFKSYTVVESCTLLSVTLILSGEVTKPITVGVIPMGHNMLSAKGTG